MKGFPKMEAEVFLDTSFAVALASETDAYHSQAVALADQLARTRTRICTSRGVLLEIGNSLANQRRRAFGANYLTFIESDPSTRIIAVDEALYIAGLSLYAQHGDKEWGLVDCISFLVMRRHGLTQVLTADHHFEQAGFEALLLSTS
jgi:predicted nucleic acid-binding protein